MSYVRFSERDGVVCIGNAWFYDGVYDFGFCLRPAGEIESSLLCFFSFVCRFFF